MIGPELTHLAASFPKRWDRHYVASKLRTDPLYDAVAENLHGSPLPLLDLGCGLGLLAFFLRSKGLAVPICGLDYDLPKIHTAKQVAAIIGSENLEFHHHDARRGLPDHHGNVTILDILQFFVPSEQETLLQITVAGDWLAKATLWMKAAPSHYPTAEDFQRILSPFGSVEISPLWGGTPFNNHLIVLRIG
jgi:trans-aconitate methyltransferase